MSRSNRIAARSRSADMHQEQQPDRLRLDFCLVHVLKHGCIIRTLPDVFTPDGAISRCAVANQAVYNALRGEVHVFSRHRTTVKAPQHEQVYGLFAQTQEATMEWAHGNIESRKYFETLDEEAERGAA